MTTALAIPTAIDGPTLEEAACLRDEGWIWTQIADALSVNVVHLVAAMEEAHPELAFADSRDLRERHEERERYWARLQRLYPPDPAVVRALQRELASAATKQRHELLRAAQQVVTSRP